MQLDEALEILNNAGIIVESSVPEISLEEFNRKVNRLDTGWEIGKLNGNRNSSAPWVLSKRGIGTIHFSTLVHEDPNGLGLVCLVRGLGVQPDENPKKDINRIFNFIFKQI